MQLGGVCVCVVWVTLVHDTNSALTQVRLTYLRSSSGNDASSTVAAVYAASTRGDYTQYYIFFLVCVLFHDADYTCSVSIEWMYKYIRRCIIWWDVWRFYNNSIQILKQIVCMFYQRQNAYDHRDTRPTLLQYSMAWQRSSSSLARTYFLLILFSWTIFERVINAMQANMCWINVYIIIILDVPLDSMLRFRTSRINANVLVLWIVFRSWWIFSLQKMPNRFTYFFHFSYE